MTESANAERVAEEHLKRAPWAKQLLDNLEHARESGDRRQQRAYLFEARIALSNGAAMYGINFASANPDPRRTAAGEMVRVVELLTRKASKFPSPRPGVYHLILADIRGYCAGSVDLDDCCQIAWGQRAVHEEANMQFFGASPVHGIFDRDNTRPHSVCAQQRIHGLGLFYGQRNRSTDVLSTQGSIYRANPLLITTEYEASRIAGLLDGGAA